MLMVHFVLGRRLRDAITAALVVILHANPVVIRCVAAAMTLPRLVAAVLVPIPYHLEEEPRRLNRRLNLRLLEEEPRRLNRRLNLRLREEEARHRRLHLQLHHRPRVPPVVQLQLVSARQQTRTVTPIFLQAVMLASRSMAA